MPVPSTEAVDVDVELRGVVKRFGRFTAVDGIDLSVSRGQFATLLGPSGCGKTTTLRMIGGLELPDSGSITIGGKPLSFGAAADRPTRMVFQNYALFPHMTVTQNVAFGLRMQKRDAGECDRLAQAMIDLLGLSGHAAKYPSQLSGGQQQRVALARALVTQPRVLLLDEPLGALDLKMRKHMQLELKKLQREVGITFVYVTHDQEEAMNLSDLIVVMDQGRIVQQGSPVEIYRHPVTAYVADFIGEANLLPGRLGAGGGLPVVDVPGLGTVAGTAAAGLGAAAGAPVLYSVRPEHVRTGADAAGQEVRHDGKVVASSFLGGATRLTIAVGPSVLRADVPGVATAASGDTIRVGWSPADARVLPDDARFSAPQRDAAA